MFAALVHWIESHPALHRASLCVWRRFPPRLAGFLKGLLARHWVVGAVAVLIDDSRHPPEVLLVEHSYRRKGIWGLPGGSLESIPGDPHISGANPSADNVVESALRREVWEELGIGVNTIRLLRIDAVPYVPEEPGPYRLDFYFKCMPEQGFPALRAGLISGRIRPRSAEVKQIRLVPLTDLALYDLYSSDARFLQQNCPDCRL